MCAVHWIAKLIEIIPLEASDMLQKEYRLLQCILTNSSNVQISAVVLHYQKKETYRLNIKVFKYLDCR